MAIEIDLSGKVAIVTGGERAAWVAASCERFLEAGADVVFCGRNEPETAPSAGARDAFFTAGDVRDPEQVDASSASAPRSS